MAIALVVAGCSGNDDNGASPADVERSGSGAAVDLDAPAPSTGATDGRPALDVPDEVNDVLALARAAAAGNTYTAAYRVVQTASPGVETTTTVTVVQRAPRFRYEAVSGSERSVAVFDGTLLHACVPAGPDWQCSAVELADDPSLVGSAFPPALLQYVDGLNSQLAGGLEASATTRTVLGADVSCASYVAQMTNPPPPVTFCVRPDGVLAYARTADGQEMELVSFSEVVDDDDLVVPGQN